MRRAIVDAGPLVAFLDHQWVVGEVEDLDAPLLVCKPVLAEFDAPASWVFRGDRTHFRTSRALRISSRTEHDPALLKPRRSQVAAGSL